MGNLDAALKQYYRNIRSELPCSWGQRNRILRQIRESVDNYLEENPDADFAAIEAHFGNAQTIASSYIDVQDAPELLRKMLTELSPPYSTTCFSRTAMPSNS